MQSVWRTSEAAPVQNLAPAAVAHARAQEAQAVSHLPAAWAAALTEVHVPLTAAPLIAEALLTVAVVATEAIDKDVHQYLILKL